MTDDGLTPEEHLSAALRHLALYQRNTPARLRSDEHAIAAATETGAAKAYTEAAREATGGR